ncbi:hypothetical protein ABT263_35930 [Kitasatospora sp. NPDC001603]|uniref:hypothetical protein n=1 Tax=Kitasatospora sp. NPDC001603 TaxID=3154388 RepID=UPI00331B7F39
MREAPVSAAEITVAFLDRFGRRRAIPVADAAEVPFEELAPVHPPVAYPGRKSFVTNAWASSTDQPLACGSLRQQHCGMVLDRDPSVGLRSAGPMELRWSCDGRGHTLRPAFVAVRAGRREVIRVQPEEPGDGWQWEQEVLAAAAEAAGWQVRVMQPPTGVELDNLSLLYAARNPRWLPQGQDDLLAEQFSSPRTIRSGVRAAGLPQAQGIDLAYHLIWADRLHIDTDALLTPASTAWTASGERG